jgi:hypothetical protein
VIAEFVMDWLTNNVAPEWIVIGSAVTSLLLMGALFVVLERATRLPHRGSFRLGRARGVRVPPYVAPGYLEALGRPSARHARTEPAPARRRRGEWRPTRREQI